MIEISVQNLKSLKQKSIGLIGQSIPKPVFFKTRFGIHTFGVRFPIDVIILNRENRVVGFKKNLKPNRLWWWNPIHNRVIELPEGTIERKNIKNRSEVKIIKKY